MRRRTEIERLYDEHTPSLFAFLLNFTRDENDTRDLLQELFEKIAREPALLRNVENERAYLIRRRGTRERTKENFAVEKISLFAPADDPDVNIFRQELAEALGELPEDQRAVVHLKLWEGLTFEEIAGALEISPNTAASRYRYGLDKLRERLRPLYREITNAES